LLPLQYRPRFLGAGELLPESLESQQAEQKEGKKKKKQREAAPSSSSDSDDDSSSSSSGSDGSDSSDSSDSSGVHTLRLYSAPLCCLQSGTHACMLGPGLHASGTLVRSLGLQELAG
jgi:hypothetical protein